MSAVCSLFESFFRAVYRSRSGMLEQARQTENANGTVTHLLAA